MKIIIVGGGKVGTTLCHQLLQEGHSIVIIDKDARNVHRMVDSYDVTGVIGNGVVRQIQEEAGVDGCDLFITCTPSDEINILCSTVAKKLGAKQTIARVRDPEYFNTFDSNELGLNMLVNPEHEAAQEIARILNYPYATFVEEFVGGKVRLLEYKIADNCVLDGIMLKDLAQRFNSKILISGIIRGEKTIIPQGNDVLAAGDRIYVVAENNQIHNFFREAAIAKRRSKRVFLLGGGRVSFYLTQRLLQNGVEVIVCEKQIEECKKFYEAFTNVTVLNVDGFQQYVLLEEGVENADAVVALSSDDENNVLISMFVNTLPNLKAIVKTDKTEYISMLKKAGIESIILPKMLTANQIIKFARNLGNAHGGRVSGLYRMLNSEAEFLEFVADSEFLGLGTKLKDMRLKPNTIIVSIVKGDSVIIPGGNDSIEADDTVFVASTVKGFDELNDILA